MIAIPKKYVRLVSWADFLLGLYFILEFFIGFDFYFFGEFIFIFPILLALSGYIINKSKLKYKTIISWLCIIIDVVIVLFLIIVLSFDNLVYEFDFLNQIIKSNILVLSPSLIVIISGFYLRKISK